MGFPDASFLRAAVFLNAFAQRVDQAVEIVIGLVLQQLKLVEDQRQGISEHGHLLKSNVG